MSNVAVDVLIYPLTGIILGVLDVEVVVEVNVNVFAGVMAAFEFVVPGPLEEFRCCWAAFDCRPMAVLDCASVLQARMPSYHV